MHGRLKVRTSEEEKIRKDNERAKKIIAYKSGLAVIFKKRSSKEFDEVGLDVSAQLVSANPDIYTLWNYRRETILFLVSQDDVDHKSSKLFDSELQLTEFCLKINPKSYCSWHQRVWVLDTRSDPDWDKELKLCNAYLKLDERNFHCWDYRRHVITRSNTALEKEFEYSTEKIHENFSNYSAWHYRSKLLTKLYPDNDGIRPIEEVHLRDELELVINAAFTDPSDTSAWFYQRWLLGASLKSKRLAVCRVTPIRSFIAFNQSVPSPSLACNVEVTVCDNAIKGEWKSLSGLKQDVLWILEHEKEICSEIFLQSDCSVKVQLHCDNGMVVVCKRSPEKEDKYDCYIGYGPTEFKNDLGVSIIEELRNQKESCEQLVELEPDSKWTQLTLAIIKHSIDHVENHESCSKIMNNLITLDSKRANYYKDLCSRWHLEYFLQTNVFWNDSIENGKFTLEEDVKSIKLSTLYHSQYWSACSKIDLSGHQLTSQSLPMMYVFQSCEILDLSDNCFTTLQGFPALPKLVKINIKGNKILSEDLRYINLSCPKVQYILTDEVHDTFCNSFNPTI